MNDHDQRAQLLPNLFDTLATPAHLPVVAPDDLLRRVLEEIVILGDSQDFLARLPRASIDLFFTSPPYADARPYSRIHPDHYVDWFLPFARSMYLAAKPSGSLFLNIKNRVANRGPLKGQRHPYVYRLVPSTRNRFLETIYRVTFPRIPFHVAGH